MPLVLLIAVAMFLLVLLSVVAVVSAAGPKACCVSRKLSGVMLTASGTHRHGAKMIDINDVSKCITLRTI